MKFSYFYLKFHSYINEIQSTLQVIDKTQDFKRTGI